MALYQSKLITAAPSAALIKGTREIAELTVREAAELVHVTTRTWQRYESGDRQMPIGLYELFCLKVGLDFHLESGDQYFPPKGATKIRE